MKKIFISSDHAGFRLKEDIKKHLKSKKFNFKEFNNISSITYSDVYQPATSFNGLSTFDPNTDNVKHYSEIDGSIQKIYARDTNMLVIHEDKTYNVPVAKDILLTADNQKNVTVSNKVLGQRQAYSEHYGISKNPESFASYAYRVYFADKNRGAILRLSRDGLTPISDLGMKDFFKDHLFLCDRIYGAYDERKGKYVISLQGPEIKGGTIAIKNSDNVPEIQDPAVRTEYRTLCYDDKIQGWTSFFTYKPKFGISLRNEFYGGEAWAPSFFLPDTGTVRGESLKNSLLKLSLLTVPFLELLSAV